MFPSCPTALMAVRQQRKHRVVSRGELESGGVAWGLTICLMACQGVSGLQPSHTCHESKIPPQQKTAVPQCINPFLSPAVNLYEYDIKLRPCPLGSWVLGLQHTERTHSITFITQLRSQVGHVLDLPELWQLAIDFL